MSGRFTVGQQIAMGFVIPLIAFTVLGGVYYQSTQKLAETSQWVTHTHEVMTNLSDMIRLMVDVETGQRGFALTGQDNFLEPYNKGKVGLEQTHETLRRLTSDNPKQQQRLDIILSITKQQITFTESVIDARRREGFEAAARLVSNGEGKRLLDGMRKLTSEMETDEKDLLAIREQDSKQSTARLTTILFGGMLAIMASQILTAIFLIQNLSRQIGTAVQHIQSSSAELQAAATQQVRGAKEQASASTEVSTTVRELVTTSRQIAETAKKVTHVAGETAAAARGGNQTVKSAEAALELVKREVHRIVTHMLELSKRSQDVGAIVDVINELAEQTNILAINATIESSGAGEAGKRFAVVADEIRRLATRTGASVKEIGPIIQEIRSATNSTVMATEDGSKAVETSTRQFSELAASFKHITEHVGNTVQAAREIELSTKQQTSAVEQVDSALSEVTRTARETEASSAQTLKTSDELANLSRELMMIVRREAKG